MQNNLPIKENLQKDPAKVISIHKKELTIVVESTEKKIPVPLPKEPEQYIKGKKHDFL